MSVEFVGCPEILPSETRCNKVAEVVLRDTMESTDGPVEFIKTRCVHGHLLYFPVSMLEKLAVSAPAEMRGQ